MVKYTESDVECDDELIAEQSQPNGLKINQSNGRTHHVHKQKVSPNGRKFDPPFASTPGGRTTNQQRPKFLNTFGSQQRAVLNLVTAKPARAHLVRQRHLHGEEEVKDHGRCNSIAEEIEEAMSPPEENRSKADLLEKFLYDCKHIKQCKSYNSQDMDNQSVVSLDSAITVSRGSDCFSLSPQRRINGDARYKNPRVYLPSVSLSSDDESMFEAVFSKNGQYVRCFGMGDISQGHHQSQGHCQTPQGHSTVQGQGYMTPQGRKYPGSVVKSSSRKQKSSPNWSNDLDSDEEKLFRSGLRRKNDSSRKKPAEQSYHHTSLGITPQTKRWNKLSEKQKFIEEVKLMQQALQRYKTELRGIETSAMGNYTAMFDELTTEEQEELEFLQMLRSDIQKEIGEMERHLATRIRSIIAGYHEEVGMSSLEGLQVIHQMVELIKEQVFHRNYITSSMSGKEDEDAHSLHSNRSHGIGSLRRSGTLDSNCSSYLQQWPLDGDTIMQELVEVKKQLTEEQKHRHLELEKSFQKMKCSLLDELKGNVNSETEQLKTELQEKEKEISTLKKQLSRQISSDEHSM